MAKTTAKVTYSRDFVMTKFIAALPASWHVFHSIESGGKWIASRDNKRIAAIYTRGNNQIRVAVKGDRLVSTLRKRNSTVTKYGYTLTIEVL